MLLIRKDRMLRSLGILGSGMRMKPKVVLVCSNIC